MEKNVLFNIYSMLICCFIGGGNFKEAKDVLEDMRKIGVENSMFLFREA